MQHRRRGRVPENLNVGYDPQEKSWDLIVKYSGSLDEVRNLGGTVVELLNGFAVITIAESEIGQLSSCRRSSILKNLKGYIFRWITEKQSLASQRCRGLLFVATHTIKGFRGSFLICRPAEKRVGTGCGEKAF